MKFLFIPELDIPLLCIFILWLVLLVDYIERRKKLTLYLLIFLSLTVFLSNLYTYVFFVKIPNPYEKFDMIRIGNWIFNILYQIICVIITIKSGLLSGSITKKVLFAIFIVITTAIFYFFMSEFHDLYYGFFVTHFN
ncbi:MAG: hypothetical protein IJQ50_00690 [Clostridia bacterium]|nr:hypothetical protein [Clostridia bacterium]